MKHIRQKNSSREPHQAYTVVLEIENINLEDHPCLQEHPEIFELVDETIPEDAQYLKYQ